MPSLPLPLPLTLPLPLPLPLLLLLLLTLTLTLTQACPSAVELLGAGKYPDGETSVRPLVFRWGTYTQATLTTNPSSPNHEP